MAEPKLLLIRGCELQRPGLLDLIDPHTFKKDYRKHGRRLGLTVEQFAGGGGSSFCAGRILRDVELAIRFNHRNLLFIVNPHDEHWFERLRSQIAERINKLGLHPEGTVESDKIRLEDARYQVGAKPITGAQERVALSSYAMFGLRLRILEIGEGRRVPEHEPPTYVYPKKVVVPGVHTSTANLGENSAKTIANEVVSNTRAVLHPIVVKVLSMGDKIPDGYVEMQKEILGQMIASKELDDHGTMRSALITANCPNIASVITDISRDVAQQVCKAAESITANSTASEIVEQANISCSPVYTCLRDNAYWWRSRRVLRHPCPRPSTLSTTTLCVPVRSVCAPLGKEVVESIETSLIKASYACPYTSVPTVDAAQDGYSSDEKPTKRATDCARQRSCYRKKKGHHHRHYAVEKNRTDDVILTENRIVTHRIQVAKGRPFRGPQYGPDGMGYGANNKVHIAGAIDLTKEVVPAGITELSLVGDHFSLAGLKKTRCKRACCMPSVKGVSADPSDSGDSSSDEETPASEPDASAQDAPEPADPAAQPADPTPAESPAPEETEPLIDLNPPSMVAPAAAPEPAPQAAVPPAPVFSAPPPVAVAAPPPAQQRSIATPEGVPAGYRPVGAHNYPPMPAHGLAIVRCTNNAQSDVTINFAPVRIHGQDLTPVDVSLRVGGITDVLIAAGRHKVTVRDGRSDQQVYSASLFFGQRFLHSIIFQKDNTVAQTILSFYVPEKLGLAKIFRTIFGKPHSPGIYIVPSSRVVNARLEQIHVPCNNPQDVLAKEVTIGDELLGEDLYNIHRFSVPPGAHSNKEITVDRSLSGTQMLVGGKWVNVEALVPLSDNSIGLVVDSPLEGLL